MKVKTRTAPNGREHQGSKLVALRAMGNVTPTARPGRYRHRITDPALNFNGVEFRSDASLERGLISLELSSLADENRAGKSPVPNLVASRSIGDSFRKETRLDLGKLTKRVEQPDGRGIRPRRENDAPSTGK